MSFGFSVGDFVTVGKLVGDTISSLRTASISEYQELILELHGLQRALNEIEHLEAPPGQEAAVNSIKVAALMCQYPLDDFATKLKQFEKLDTVVYNQSSEREKLQVFRKKLRWGFCMKEEVVKLRAILMAHVGSLNMRLNTQSLSAASLVAAQNRLATEDLGLKVGQSHEVIVATRKDIEVNQMTTRSNESLLQQLSTIVTRDVLPQLKILVDLANKTWHLNMQMMDIVVKLSSTPSPDPRYTWYQKPVRFEDARGQVFPVPSEYNWGKLEAIIQDQFSTGLGGRKVAAGEYELYNALDNSQVISQSQNEVLTPGLKISMAIIFGRYGPARLSCCPNPFCRSTSISQCGSGSLICSICQACFGPARKSLPLPLRPRPPEFDNAERFRLRMEGLAKNGPGGVADSEFVGNERYDRLRAERRTFKNIRIRYTTLAKSPEVSNVRTKHRYFPEKDLRYQGSGFKGASLETPQSRRQLASPWDQLSEPPMEWRQQYSHRSCAPYSVPTEEDLVQRRRRRDIVLLSAPGPAYQRGQHVYCALGRDVNGKVRSQRYRIYDIWVEDNEFTYNLQGDLRGPPFLLGPIKESALRRYNNNMEASQNEMDA